MHGFLITLSSTSVVISHVQIWQPVAGAYTHVLKHIIDTATYGALQATHIHTLSLSLTDTHGSVRAH